MAVTEVMDKNVVQVRLNDGLDSHGNVKTVNLNLGSLSGSASDWDAQKAMNIIEALIPCLSKSVDSVYHVQSNLLQD